MIEKERTKDTPMQLSIQLLTPTIHPFLKLEMCVENPRGASVTINTPNVIELPRRILERDSSMLLIYRYWWTSLCIKQERAQENEFGYV